MKYCTLKDESICGMVAFNEILVFRNLLFDVKNSVGGLNGKLEASTTHSSKGNFNRHGGTSVSMLVNSIGVLEMKPGSFSCFKREKLNHYKDALYRLLVA